MYTSPDAATEIDIRRARLLLRRRAGPMPGTSIVFVAFIQLFNGNGMLVGTTQPVPIYHVAFHSFKRLFHACTVFFFIEEGDTRSSIPGGRDTQASPEIS